MVVFSALAVANNTPVPSWVFYLVVAFIIGSGIFAIRGAVADWDWFFKDDRAGLVVGLFGRQGARVVYAILGVVVILAGLLLLWLLVYATLKEG